MWVTRPERPNCKDEVRRPDGPPARSLLVKDIGDKLADRDLFPAIKREASRGDSHLSCSSLAAVDLKMYCNIYTRSIVYWNNSKRPFLAVFFGRYILVGRQMDTGYVGR